MARLQRELSSTFSNLSKCQKFLSLSRKYSKEPSSWTPLSVFPYDNFFRNEVTKKKVDQSYRIFKKVDRDAHNFPVAREADKNIVVWCSNDYMGLSSHPLVKQAAIEAIQMYGTGTGGSRNISGNSSFHERLESELAALHGKEKALLFTSGFVANDSAICSLAQSLPDCYIFSDAGNHASLIQGIRNSRVPKHIFHHNDPMHLESLLKTVSLNIPKIVAFETIHSMDGSICPVKAICEVSQKYGALTFADEVHAVGLYGDTGGGIGERDNLTSELDIISGTLGKSFGAVGGYIAGKTDLVDLIRNCAPGFIFTTSLPPADLAAGITAIRILKSQEGRVLRARHQNNVKYLKAKLIDAEIPVLESDSHVLPIMIGDVNLSNELTNQLLTKKGHYIQAINYPTVPRGTERLRLAPTPLHTVEMMDNFVDSLVEIWRHLNIPHHCGDHAARPRIIAKQ